MPQPTPSEAELEVEVALLEAEVLLAVEFADAGRVVPGRRAPTTAEVRAGVAFADLDRIVEDAAARLARRAAEVRSEVLDRLALDLGSAAAGGNPEDLVRRLNLLVDPTSDAQLPGIVEEVLTPARTDAYRILADTHEAAGVAALEEARRQGAPLEGRLPPAPARRVTNLLTDRGNALIVEPYRRLLDVARNAAVAAPPTGDPFELLDVALTAAEQASPAGTEDLARQAAGVAHDEGRTATIRDLAGIADPAAPAGIDRPAGLEPREVYASELLDSNTCGPCSHVDGRDYPDLEAGLADYPGNGGYAECDGGSRCRGTLVIVWDTEAAPTIDDRRGEGPEAPPRRPVEPPPAPAPAPVPVAQLDDTDLMAGITRALEAGDTARADELGDELDRRDAADQAARLEHPPALVEQAPDSWGWGADDEAWQIAEEYAGDADAYARDLARAAEEYEQRGEAALLDGIRDGITGQAGGRRIDRVRDEWAAELERRYVELEDAARGGMLRADRQEEFLRKYGSAAVPEVLLAGPARTAYYYASEEVRTVWAARPRITFAEFAEQRGVRDAKTLARARTAREARDEAAARAEEGASTAARRAVYRGKRRRQAIPASEGDKLRRAQARAARERRRAEDLNRRAGGEAGGLS